MMTIDEAKALLKERTFPTVCTDSNPALVSPHAGRPDASGTRSDMPLCRAGAARLHPGARAGEMG